VNPGTFLGEIVIFTSKPYFSFFMSRNKTDLHFAHIEELKNQFRNLTTEVIVSRLTNFNKTNNIVLAYKQILKERGIDDYLSALN